VRVLKTLKRIGAASSLRQPTPVAELRERASHIRKNRRRLTSGLLIFVAIIIFLVPLLSYTFCTAPPLADGNWQHDWSRWSWDPGLGEPDRRLCSRRWLWGGETFPDLQRGDSGES